MKKTQPKQTPPAAAPAAITQPAAETLGVSEGEFRTLSITRIGADYFVIDANGGNRGAWEVRYGQHANTTRSIDRTEARRLLLEMDMDPETVAAKTKE